MLKVGTLILGTLFSCYVFADGLLQMKHPSEKSTFVKDGKTLGTKAKILGDVFGVSANHPLKQKSTASSASSLKSFDEGSHEEEILIDEDFSGITEGTSEKPGNNMLCYYYDEPGMYIDASLTKDGQWAGSFVYPAGGMVALISPNTYTAADLDTPLGDYSGCITLTFKVKAIKNSDLFVNLLRGGYNDCLDTKNLAGDINVLSYRLYKKEGWKKVTVKMSNVNADPDGFIQFHSYGSVLIDDVQVTTSSEEFVAPPALLPETNIKNTSFQANWQPTRKAFNYVVNLYKKVYTSDKDTVITENFDNVAEDGSNLPSGWSFSLHADKKVQPVGVDGSNALYISNGDTIVTPYTFSKVKDMSMWVRFYDPVPYGDDDMNWDAFDAVMHVEALSLSGWTEVVTLEYSETTSLGTNVNIGKEIGTNKYYGFRFFFTGLPEGDYAVVDNINLTMGRPGKLAPAEFDLGGGDMDTEDRTYGTSYVFSGLDPEGDYYYTVNTHYLMQYSNADVQHLVAVASPTLKEATNITADAYQANWEEVGKADKYEAYCYGVQTVSEKGQYSILDEDFSGIEDEQTDPSSPDKVGNTEDMSLDEYTKLPGWSVSTGAAIVNGMIGCASSNYYTYYVTTPQLYLGNDSMFYLHVKAYGAPGEGLVINVGGHESGAYFEATDATGKLGIIDKTFEMDCSQYSHGQLYIYTLSHGYFLLDEVKVAQNLKAGDKIYTYLATGEVADSKTTSCVFNSLTGYDQYAFAVKSLLDRDGDTAESELSDFMLVNLNGTYTSISEHSSDVSVHEVARYTADGKLIAKPVKGLNIVKMSDGKVVKVVVR